VPPGFFHGIAGLTQTEFQQKIADFDFNLKVKSLKGRITRGFIRGDIITTYTILE
jgi:hypothetical protein